MTTKKLDWVNLDRHLTDEEKDQLLVDWIDYQHDYEDGKQDHDRLYDMAQRFMVVLQEDFCRD
tara:strand:- start:401 stop:589 length:189 start_codon:yes stop_codon:yes gene_type:complete